MILTDRTDYLPMSIPKKTAASPDTGDDASIENFGESRHNAADLFSRDVLDEISPSLSGPSDDSRHLNIG